MSKHGVELDQRRAYRGERGKPLGPDARGPQSLAPGEQSQIPFYVLVQAPQRFPGSSVEGITTVFGRIDYLDAFNAKHWTTFCYYGFDEKGDLMNCLSGNSEDKNREPVPTKAHR